MSPSPIALAYLVAAVCFILALKGLSSPRYARQGNLAGAAGAVVAVGAVLLAERPANLVAILAAIVGGTGVGLLAARRVVMTAMPQLVAVFNGVGGAAGALVALIEIAGPGALGWWRLAVAAFAVLVGSVA